MRTTLTLDDDVAVRLEEERQRRQTAWKTVVNDALRVGLDAMRRQKTARKAFRTTGLDLGPSMVGSLDNIEEVLSRVEGEEHP